MQLINGSKVQAASAECADSVRGSGFDGVVLDEAAFMDQNVWHDVVRPAIEDRGGWATFITTPNGLNWFHDTFRVAQVDKTGTWYATRRKSTENPLMNPERVRDIVEEIGPRSYAQEFDAEFVATEGACWPSEYFPDSIWVDDWPANVYTTQIALDPSLGRTDNGDYSAIITGKLDITTGLIYLSADLERRDPEKMSQDLVTIAKQHQPDRVTVEANGFQQVLGPRINQIALSQGYMIPIFLYHNKVEKTARIKHSLTPYLNQGLIRIVGRNRHNKLFYDQLTAFPIADHDDGPDGADMVIRAMWDHVRTVYREETTLSVVA